jgi:hypothetical protein
MERERGSEREGERGGEREKHLISFIHFTPVNTKFQRNRFVFETIVEV